jgi:phosphate transport system substrate-binding protein
MIKMKQVSGILILVAILFASCKNGKKVEEVSRTAGNLTMLVDESFDDVISDQIEVFKTDYPDANFKVISGNENKILPTFLNDSIRTIVLSRRLTPREELAYRQRSIVIHYSRFAIDGIALITNKQNKDSVVTAEQIISILKGNNTGTNLVFDNAYSSTLRYFKELSQVSQLPSKGVYTLKTNDDVIKYVAENKNYIGVLGVNWLLEDNEKIASSVAKIKMLGVKNIKGKKGDDAFYKPTQDNLISGIYPFLRNVYIINCEGKDGLGTGFANWLTGPRGQLIVLRSGLGPHKIISREFNLKSTN